jgi:hypothetical protein
MSEIVARSVKSVCRIGLNVSGDAVKSLGELTLPREWSMPRHGPSVSDFKAHQLPTFCFFLSHSYNKLEVVAYHLLQLIWTLGDVVLPFVWRCCGTSRSD